MIRDLHTARTYGKKFGGYSRPIIFDRIGCLANESTPYFIIWSLSVGYLNSLVDLTCTIHIYIYDWSDKAHNPC